MRDDFLSRDWADHHGEMSSGITKLFRIITESFERLHAYQFDAPWRDTKCDDECA